MNGIFYSFILVSLYLSLLASKYPLLKVESSYQPASKYLRGNKELVQFAVLLLGLIPERKLNYSVIEKESLED